MAVMNVNPTRMELFRLKRQLEVARRGHKLLKGKQDAMVKEFMVLVRKNYSLRKEVETKLERIMKYYDQAKIKISKAGILEALMVPSNSIEIVTKTKEIMNIKTPALEFKDQGKIDLTYGFAFTPSDLDEAIIELASLLPSLVELAGVEKASNMLAKEIEKTRRRVNAIEFFMIPDLEDTLHYIQMKLDDSERSNIVRLMKSKEIILNKGN
jgi:V/A-type H+-transporting ATPase subunit D